MSNAESQFRRDTIESLEEENESLCNRLVIAEKALREIKKGEGPFSRDHLKHATNTIEAMKELADEALNQIQEKEDQ